MKIIKFFFHPIFVAILSTYLIGSLHTAVIAIIVASFGIWVPQKSLWIWWDE